MLIELDFYLNALYDQKINCKIWDIRVKVEKRYWQKTYAAFQENLQSIDGDHKKLKIFASLTASLQVVYQKKIILI